MRIRVRRAGVPAGLLKQIVKEQVQAIERDLVTGDTVTPCWLQISSARGDLAQVPSSDTPIVVIEPTEYGDCVDAAVCLERPSNRLLGAPGLGADGLRCRNGRTR